MGETAPCGRGFRIEDRLNVKARRIPLDGGLDMVQQGKYRLHWRTEGVANLAEGTREGSPAPARKQCTPAFRFRQLKVFICSTARGRFNPGPAARRRRVPGHGVELLDFDASRAGSGLRNSGAERYRGWTTRALKMRPRVTIGRMVERVKLERNGSWRSKLTSPFQGHRACGRGLS